MYGGKINRLNLRSVDNDNGGKETLEWTRSGNRGPEWKHGQVNFKASSSGGGNYAFVFEGESYNNYLCVWTV